MKDSHEGIRSMWIAVKDYLEIATWMAIWSGNVAFSALKAALDNFINSYALQAAIQAGDITGITVNKKNLREALIQQLMPVVAALYVFAQEDDDPELEARVDFEISDLRDMRDTELLDAAQNLIDDGNANIGALGDYGIDAAYMTTTGNALGAYSAVIAKPTTAIVTRSVATANMEQIIRQGQDHLNEKMDKMINLWRFSEPDFFNGYFEARKIRNTTPDSEVETVTVTIEVRSAADNSLQEGALVEDLTSGQSQTTDVSGTVTFDYPGSELGNTHTYRASKPGFTADQEDRQFDDPNITEDIVIAPNNP